MTDCGVGEPLAVLARTGGHPALVAFDVAALDVGDASTRWVILRHLGGEESQGQTRGVDCGRASRNGELVQVAGHGGCHLRSSDQHVGPRHLLAGNTSRRVAVRKRKGREDAHWATPICAWASMASAARRYSLANQSPPR